MAGFSGHGSGVGVRRVPILKDAGLTKIVAGLAIAGLAGAAVLAWANRQLPTGASISADESLLLEMDELAHAARCAHVLIGRAPASKEEIASVLTGGPLPFGYNPCTDYNVVMHAPMPGQTGSEMVRAVNQRLDNITHLRPELTRMDDRIIRLCGVFENRSGGQDRVAISYDDAIALDTEALTRPREAGRSCFEVDTSLPYTVAELRDASRLAEMDAAATAAECASTEGDLPATLDDIVNVILDLGRGQDPLACNVRSLHLAGAAAPGIDYKRLSSHSIQLCSSFETAGPASAGLRADYDVQQRAHFPELMVERPAPGRHCYAISLRRDNGLRAPLIWDDPISIEALDPDMQADARRDRLAIADVVRVLQLARCAWLMRGEVAETFEGLLATTEANAGLAARHGCDWPSHHYASPANTPVARYARVDADTVRVCAGFARAWPQPLRLNFSGRETEPWPGSLPDLRQPVEPGERCYEADVGF